jgi:hypothetical protein
MRGACAVDHTRVGTVLKVCLGILLAVAVLIVGCGALLGAGVEEAQKQSDKKAITDAQARSIRIGTPKAAIIAQFGQPEDSQEDQFKGLGKSSCIYYNVKGELASFWQFCFDNKDRLDSKSGY